MTQLTRKYRSLDPESSGVYWTLSLSLSYMAVFLYGLFWSGKKVGFNYSESWAIKMSQLRLDPTCFIYCWSSKAPRLDVESISLVLDYSGQTRSTKKWWWDLPAPKEAISLGGISHIICFSNMYWPLDTVPGTMLSTLVWCHIFFLKTSLSRYYN